MATQTSTQVPTSRPSQNVQPEPAMQTMSEALGQPEAPARQEYRGPRKANGEPDGRYKKNEHEGTASFDSRHRNPHQGAPSPLRRRFNRPMALPGQIANRDGTLDLRFLENRVIAGLVDPRELGLSDEDVERIKRGEALIPDSDYDQQVKAMHAKQAQQAPPAHADRNGYTGAGKA